MLNGIHGQARRQHQHQNDKHRGHQLLLFVGNNVRDHIERVIIGTDPEKPQNSRHPEQPEGHHPRREEHGQIVGEEGEQVDNAGPGGDVFQAGVGHVPVRVKAGGGVETKHIVNGEKGDGYGVYLTKQLTVAGGYAVKRTEKRSDQVDQQQAGADDVISLVDGVIHHADGYHLEYLLPEGKLLLILLSRLLLFHCLRHSLHRFV